MAFCDCTAIDHMFNPRTAQRDLKRFRKRGPAKQTQALLSGIAQAPNVVVASRPTLARFATENTGWPRTHRKRLVGWL